MWIGMSYKKRMMVSDPHIFDIREVLWGMLSVVPRGRGVRGGRRPETPSLLAFGPKERLIEIISASLIPPISSA